jgi:hypothetical protein
MNEQKDVGEFQVSTYESMPGDVDTPLAVSQEGEER